jgi:uncharacterized iron-regulated membrane protein
MAEVTYDNLVMLLVCLSASVLVLMGLVIYLIYFLVRVETALWQIDRALRPPQVLREANGRKLFERL